MLNKTKQELNIELESRVKSTTSRATRGVEQTKARKIETETCLQRAERLQEALSKTKQDLRLTQRQLVNNETATFEHLEVLFNYLTDNAATVYPNT